jgi:hypothetical protein
MSVKRLVPLHAVVLEENPTEARIGDIYYNESVDELRYFDGENWNPVGGAITGLLDHIHTYDGAVYSVESNQIPASGFVDGGDPNYSAEGLNNNIFDGGTP